MRRLIAHRHLTKQLTLWDSKQATDLESKCLGCARDRGIQHQNLHFAAEHNAAHAYDEQQSVRVEGCFVPAALLYCCLP